MLTRALPGNNNSNRSYNNTNQAMANVGRLYRSQLHSSVAIGHWQQPVAPAASAISAP